MAELRKTVVNPDTIGKPLKGYYSNSVRVSAGPLLFIAGQVALDKDNKLVGKGDLRAQAVQAIENVKAICEASGATLADIVQVTVYVTDMRAFDDITDIRDKYFPKDGPASAIVEISKLAWPEFMIEIAAVATVPSE